MSSAASQDQDIPTRISTVQSVLEEISKREVLKILKSHLNAPTRAAALARVKTSKERLQAILDGLPTPPAGGSLTEVQAASADCALTYVETVVAFSPSPDMRIAQFDGYEKLKDDHDAEFAEAEKSADPKQAALEVLEKIKEATEKLKQIVEHPEKFVRVVDFWNKLVRPDPGLSKFQLLAEELQNARQITFNDIIENDLDTKTVFADLLASKDQQATDVLLKQIQLTAKDMQIAAEWLGAAVVLLTATTLVLNAVADDKHWASEVAKSAVSIGTGLLLSEISAALLTAANSALVAAGITAEAVPVGLFLLVTGVVILVAWAIDQVFSFLLETIFGGPIPPSMRAEMAAPMEASMRLSMAASMVKSMV